MSRLVLVRHGRPEVAPGRPPSTWNLAEQSYDDARRLAAGLGPLSQPLVLASAEPKAVQTAEALGLGPVVSKAAFNEVGKPWYDDSAEQRATTSSYLAGQAVSGWEPVGEVVRRFDDELSSASAASEVILVTHGTVMTAWLDSRRLIADPSDFWARLNMPDAWEVDLDAQAIWRLTGPSRLDGASDPRVPVPRTCARLGPGCVRSDAGMNGADWIPTDDLRST